MAKILLLAICLLLGQMVLAQNCTDTIPASTPDSRFTLNGDEVIDTVTNLIWQRCSLGHTGGDCRTGSAKLYKWQEALQAAGAPWRLPNINELRSIVEEKCDYPAINLVIFPNTIPGDYWSASPYLAGGYAWYVFFEYGLSFGGSYGDITRGKYVRLVRDGL